MTIFTKPINKIIYKNNGAEFIFENIIRPRVIRVAIEFYNEFSEIKGTGQILHELIKRELIRICTEIGLTPLPEISNPKKETESIEKQGILDILFWDNDALIPIFAFEVDRGIKSESIKKLIMHGGIVNKCIISFGDKSPKDTKLKGTDIYIIDVTKEKIENIWSTSKINISKNEP